MTRWSLGILFLIVASAECRGAEECGFPGFRRFSDVLGGPARPSIVAAQRWLTADGQDVAKLFVAVASTKGREELHVIDELECRVASHRGCAGKFCATLIYDPERGKIGNVIYWK